MPHLSLTDDSALAVHAHAILELGEACEEISSRVTDAFTDTLRRIVASTVGEGPAAQQALADGGLVINDRTVVVRLNPETDFAEFFCDIGQPHIHRLEAVYRTALEANLCRQFPGVTLGIHPDSGRLVATLALNGLMMDNEEFCMMTLDMLTRCAWQIRESGLFALED